MNTWVLDQKFAADLQSDLVKTHGNGWMGLAQRQTLIRMLEAHVLSSLQELEPGITFFVHHLSGLEDGARDIDFLIVRVTPGREVTHITSSVLSELALHEATLPEKRVNNV